MSDDHFATMERRYREHAIPWDDPLPPPEVIEQAKEMEPGHMLDLGCGTGRACIHLALQGWRCTGVDFVPQAIEMAQERARLAQVEERIAFHVASVTALSFLAGPYDLAVDVGCLHALRGDDLHAYAAHVGRLVRPGGSYLLFARLYERESEEQDGRRGLAESTITSLFAPAFVLKRAERGITQMSDSAWESGWYWMVRNHQASQASQA